MLLSLNGHRAILLLALTQNLVFASMYDEKNKTDSLSEIIYINMQVPWLDGIDWLLYSSESSEVNKVKAWIQATESGERWAVQMLDNMLERQREIPEEKVQDIGISGQCIKVYSHHNDTSIWSYHYMESLDNASVISEELSSSACNASSIDETQAIQLKPHTPVGSEDFTIGEMATMITRILTMSAFTSTASYNKRLLFFFCTIGAFMFSCTICDFMKRRKPGSSSTTVNTLAEFSLYTNAVAILSTKVTSQSMPALHGIRCLSCCSIMIAHHYSMIPGLSRHGINILDILEYKTSWLAIYIYAALFAVDTFLIIAGFLTTYLFFKSIKSGVKFNFLTMYLYRYFRLTPCLAVIMLFVAILFHRTGSGPSWKSLIDAVVNSCQERWWINLFYIQNFTSATGMCLPNTWYLAVDMQLFWMSPIILYPLYRWPKFGLGIVSFFFAASVITPTVQLAVNGYSYAVLRLDMDMSRQIESFSSYYMSTISRACPYLIGILLGYDIATKKRRLNRVNVAVNWTVAGGLALFCVWGNYQSAIHDFAYDSRMETMLGFLIHPVWSIAMAWVIYACTQGYGGIATRFLSLPFFIPISRLSYCIYLVHMLIQGAIIDPPKTHSIFWGSEIFIRIFGEIVLSIIVAFALSLFIESPVIVLIKILLNRGTQPKRAALMQKEHNIVNTTTDK